MNLNNIRINKNFNDYLIVTSSNFDELKTYDKFLSQNIPNYKSILKNNSIIVPNNKTIQQYYDDRKQSLYLNIKYVKKTGFLNIPIISIL